MLTVHFQLLRGNENKLQGTQQIRVRKALIQQEPDGFCRDICNQAARHHCYAANRQRPHASPGACIRCGTQYLLRGRRWQRGGSNAGKLLLTISPFKQKGEMYQEQSNSDEP